MTNSKHTLTENNDVQYRNSGNDCLDLFYSIGAMRNVPTEAILKKFKDSYSDNKELTMKILFWARSARNGAGERRVFKEVIDCLLQKEPKFVYDNLEAIVEHGYFKDLLNWFDHDPVVEFFSQHILDKDGLACKWAPRKGPKARQLRDSLRMTNKEYRQHIKNYSATVEQCMSANNWKAIKYPSVPGKAMRKYSRAFENRDHERYTEFVTNDNVKASVSASYPHEVLNLVLSKSDQLGLAEKQWSNLPNYIGEGTRILPMVDTSGSMAGLPLLVALSLGLYISEKNKGQFENTFLTFSRDPELVTVEGDLLQKFRTAAQSNWDMNTDFEKAYKKILSIAKTFNLTQDQMPTMLLVLSDMQFDESYSNHQWYESDSTRKPAIEEIRSEFEYHDYEMPKLVFWNLRESRCAGSPAQCNDEGVALVSGFSPVLMKAILKNEHFNPVEIMKEAVRKIHVNTNNLPSNEEFKELEVIEQEMQW